MSEYVREARFKLEESKFFHEQMKLNFQDKTKFLNYLDAFLSAARAVTFVFKKGREKMGDALVRLYDSKVECEWKADKIMRLLKELRNVSIKEHTPKTQTTAAVHMSLSVTIGNSLGIKKVSPEGKLEQRATSPQETAQQPEVKPQAPTNSTIVSYSFYELPKWFDKDRDVMHLCKEWLNKLEGFVVDAEKKVGMKQD
jgi:hypothetical protein